MKARVRAIFSHVKGPLDAIVLMNATEPHLDLSFFYATGLESGLFEGSTAILKPNGACQLVVPRLEEEIARNAGLRVSAYVNRDERRRKLQGALRGLRTVGINADEMVHRDYVDLRKLAKRARLVDASKALSEARMVKDKAELEVMRRSCTIACRALEDILPSIEVGQREYEVAAAINAAMQRRGASGPSFTTIVASGPNSALPHHTAGPRKLRRRDFVVIDYGASYRRYASDVTRTVVVGKPTAKHRDIYDTVARAQAEATAAVREGAEGKAVDKVARDIIDASPYKGAFIHGLGHSLGLAVHDGGGLNPSSKLVLRRGMVMTVEPGIYLPKFGGVRIEDDVVVRSRGGPEVMSDVPRDLIEVG